jgi:ATP-dependent DNA helicase RecG
MPIHRADDGLPYVRRGAQNLPVNTPEALKRLELIKGIVSFETEPVAGSKEVITESGSYAAVPAARRTLSGA